MKRFKVEVISYDLLDRFSHEKKYLGTDYYVYDGEDWIIESIADDFGECYVSEECETEIYYYNSLEEIVEAFDVLEDYVSEIQREK